MEHGVRGRSRWIELAAVAVMGLSSVATAWSSYQAALWSGNQSTAYVRASALRVESTRASGRANTLGSLDVATFIAWVEGYAREDTMLTTFYESRFRDEFKPAFNEWVASRPRVNPEAAASPFQLDSYRLHENAVADSLTAEAEAAFREGQRANDWSDRYVLTLVLFASVLFLTGLAQTAEATASRVGLLVLSGLLFLGATYGLAVLPRL
jgi:hypothetical protein